MSRKSREIIDYIIDPENRPFYALQLTEDANFPVNRVYYLLNKLQNKGLIQSVDPPLESDEFRLKALHYDLPEGSEEVLRSIQPTRLEELIGRISMNPR